ncbi:IS110 family transposase [Verrucomicrobiota bacterium]
MKFYKTTTEYNCGIDLHSRQMYMCLMDSKGNKLVHTNITGNDFNYFLSKIKPYKHDLTVCCECIFTWYWLADACEAEGLKFVLAHAFYLRLIHGGKNKNDRLDSEKIAHLLRSNMIPPSYVYPAAKRPARDLLRKRMSFVWRRATLLSQLTNSIHVIGKQPVKKTQHKVRNKWFDQLRARYENPLTKMAAEANMFMIKEYDTIIRRLELAIVKETKREHCKDFNLLQTIPGIGKILALTILYEVDDINRFPKVQNFSSFSRLVKGSVASAGKFKGLRGGKMGNPYLRWAFGEAAVICKRDNPDLKAYAKKLDAKHIKPVANAILANKLARSVYFMLKHGKGFDPKLFAKGC